MSSSFYVHHQNPGPVRVRESDAGFFLDINRTDDSVTTLSWKDRLEAAAWLTLALSAVKEQQP